MIEKINNRYEIIKSLGSGGMADVYLAKDTILNRQVAVKVLKDSLASDEVAVERFQREAIASTKLSHPNTVDIYDVGSDGNIHYIAMEYVKGRTLKQLIKFRGSLDPDEALLIMKQISGAIMEAHRNGIIHRDIKPQNIIVQDDGTAKILDFGIAIANGISKVTNNHSIVGSVHYLAPEIAKGKDASMKSDIYALGVVFYEMLAGDTPYKGDTPVAVAIKHTNEPFPSVRKINPNVPISIENIIYKCTAKNTDLRYENIAYLIKDLNSVNLKEDKVNDIKIENSKKNRVNIPSKSPKNNVENSFNENNTKVKGPSKIIVAVLTIISVLIATIVSAIILYIGGYISFGTNSITMPNIVGYKITEAADLLDVYNLTIDYENITRVITDDVEKGYIISSEPIEGTTVNKGDVVTIVVSNGKLQTVEDYVGKDVDEATKELEDLGFVVKTVETISDSGSYGEVVSQTGFKAGDSYDPNSTNTITLYYVKYNGMYIIESDYKGRSVDEVKSELSSKGFSVKLEKTSSSTSGCEAGKVCSISPSGTYYEQKDDNAITIKYYN